jgi:hypothetical protein
MDAIEQQALATTYSVEVSGWDHSHAFFVERSELTWSERNREAADAFPQASYGGDGFCAPAAVRRRGTRIPCGV